MIKKKKPMTLGEKSAQLLALEHLILLLSTV